jgi:predicted Zn-dependent peptidase
VTSFPVERWRLANGLRVVVQPDPRWPVVASAICYDAGSRADAPARSGLAHLCEHLAFDGPASRADRTYPARIERAGGLAQAATMADRLCFSAVFPRGAIATVLGVEAERMARPYDPQDAGAIDVQRRILLAELRRRSQGRLRALAFEQIHRLLFPPAHPYHRPPAGEADGIRAIAADDVCAYIAGRFAPRHAILVLVGDLSVASAADLVRGAFEGLPAGDEQQEPACDGPLPQEARTLRVPAAVAGAQAHVAWRVAGFGQADWYVASLLMRGLGAGRSSPLSQELIDRLRVAREVHGGLIAMRDASTLVFTASAASGVDGRTLEAALIDALDRRLASGLSAAGLARARKKALSDHYFAVQSLERRADLCASLCCYLDAPQRLESEPDRYLGPTAPAVAAFAAWLRRQPARATVSLVPRAEAA